MKANSIKTLLAICAISLSLASCTKETNPNTPELLVSATPSDIIEVKSDGATTFALAGVTPAFDSTADLTADEIEFIYAVREDEKVARDLYFSFFGTFGLKPFENIGKAEDNHIKATEKLFDYYEIDYPALSENGKFENAIRQKLFDSLLLKGTPELEAFKVMAMLEESNIVEYGEVLKTIANPNIKIVIENLARASANHFKAAIRQITALGGTYTPALMTQEQYKAVIAIGFEKGKRYMYKNNGSTTNSGNKLGGNGQKKGSVNRQGNCNSSSNGATPGSQNRQGNVGKGYRGGK
ncbi:MAG: DUF2202 domain-containing protein [Bacteroidales bacterium]|nr:DUF2202 domain-containing protein [Bacteroidales bacterium]